jgi:regulatory protein
MTDERRPLAEAPLDSAAAAFAKAADLLALRPHFSAELAQKLARKGFDGAAIATTVVRLVELGYLDDLATARVFAEQRVARQGWGPRKLVAELSRRGVAESQVREVVAEAFAAGERAAARGAAARALRKGSSRGDKLARYLDRRGFSKGVIVEILHEFAGEAGSDHEEF